MVIDRVIDGLRWLLLGALVTAMLCGCSATRAIGNAAREAQAQASEGIGNLDAAIATGDVGPKAMPFIKAARGNLTAIVGVAQNISDVVASGDVRDSDNIFVKLIKGIGWLTFAAILAGVCFLVWRFWPYIQAATGWIPRLINQRAENAVAFVNDPSPVTNEDVPTIRDIERAKADPRFNKAFKTKLAASGRVT